MAVDAKGRAFARKTGKILANRYGEMIDERMAGWAASDDPDTYTREAILAIKHELTDALYAMVEEAIAVRQGGGDE